MPAVGRRILICLGGEYMAVVSGIEAAKQYTGLKMSDVQDALELGVDVDGYTFDIAFEGAICTEC